MGPESFSSFTDFQNEVIDEAIKQISSAKNMTKVILK